MRNFYNTSLVVLASIVSMSAYCGNNEEAYATITQEYTQRMERDLYPMSTRRAKKLRELERHTEAIRHDTIICGACRQTCELIDKVCQRLSEKDKKEEQARLLTEDSLRNESQLTATQSLSQADTNNKEKERKKESAAAVHSRERERKTAAETVLGETTETSDLMFEVLSGLQALNKKARAQATIKLCDDTIQSFKGDIPYEKEWELFCTQYQNKAHSMTPAIQTYYNTVPRVDRGSALADIVRAYCCTRTALHGFIYEIACSNPQLDPYAVRSLNARIDEITALGKNLFKQGAEEAFKQYEKARQELEDKLKVIKEEEALSNEALKKQTFVVAMIKKYKIILKPPYSNSDFVKE